MKILSALLSLHFRGLIQSHIPSLFVLNKQSMFLVPYILFQTNTPSMHFALCPPHCS